MLAGGNLLGAVGLGFAAGFLVFLRLACGDGF